MASLGEDNLVLFYYLSASASEIWPDKRGGLRWGWSCRKGLQYKHLAFGGGGLVRRDYSIIIWSYKRDDPRWRWSCKKGLWYNHLAL